MKSSIQFEMLQGPAGAEIPVASYPVQNARGILLMLPAMGVRASFYRPMAEALNQQGVSVFLMEQRGHGQSPYRASRKTDFTCREYIEEDIKTTVAWIKGQSDNAIPLYLGGHSMGGHMTASYVGLFGDDVDGMMIIACGLPHAEAFDNKVAKRLTKLSRLLPFILFFWGYYPGEKIGFAGNEFRSFMKDWLGMVKTGNYQFSGIDADIEKGIQVFDKPVHVFSIEGDDFAPVKSALAVTDKFKNATVHHRHLLASDLNNQIGHFDWVRGMNVGGSVIADALFSKD
ncbi:alpha/beta fold hydrolase [Kordiimonas sp. SCSIO 12610]|uniref:alpha/beta hydrolase family protein n=1 Tax=Kordiimonas sp. SCSIO 12610 TaxID=2829597 RepID=UPI00210EE6BD|nr:alpha/beta fold hydrolase [Kordiimonas sp. SCSIO 12610]UTW56717.1 alpha/beta fold hydrolase [Kordiimonas sp. SCSIO 12610]